jgi:chromosomal replication initiator protein
MEVKSATEIWETALGELQVQVSKPNFHTWLEKTTGLSHEDNCFVVGTPNAFIAEYLKRHQCSLIERTLINIIHQEVTVTFSVMSYQQCQNTSGRRREMVMAASSASLRFNPRYTFDSFVVGSSNHFAREAALEVAEQPGHGYNPLFIHSNVGLGKTHLLQAIGQKALDNNCQVLYVSGEQFTNEFISAIQEKNMKTFRSKYQKADMLLVDDIQFISGKEQTEECFFHTFNALHNASRQIVLACDRSPSSLRQLGDRLRSRFEWGLIVDIKTPDFETRRAITRAKAEEKQLNLDEDVVNLLAHHAPKNIRELEGNLNRVTAYARLLRKDISKELASRALEGLFDGPARNGQITPAEIVAAVASTFQISDIDLKSRKRDKATALAREIAMYLLRQEESYSLADIGKELGGRNPSTVSHACEKVASTIGSSSYLRRKVQDIHDLITSRHGRP